MITRLPDEQELPTPVTTPVQSPAAWRGSDLSNSEEWTRVVSPAEVAELDACLNAHDPHTVTVTQLTRDAFPLSGWRETVHCILECMETGRGFLRLRGLPVARWGEDRTRLALWAIGTHLGWAESQDGAGSLMHDVRDTGRAFGADDNIRYFQTRQAIDLHNDGADIFALACLRQGNSGGTSRIVSAVEVFNEVARRRPDLAAVLQQDFHVDARGQRTDGARCQVIPIYAFAEGQITILLKLAYIDSAQRFDEVPRLSEQQQQALELLAQVMDEHGMALEFDLAPGDVLFASNHVTLHGRSAFTDPSAGDAGRHMLRLWLTIPNGRPLPPHYADTREFAATYARRVARDPS